MLYLSRCTEYIVGLETINTYRRRSYYQPGVYYVEYRLGKPCICKQQGKQARNLQASKEICTQPSPSFTLN